jgi:ketosteroid isomerase-like protein
VREVLEGWTTGTGDPLESFAEDCVWDSTSFPDGEIVHGHEGIRGFMRKWLGTWQQYELHVEEVFEAGDQVLALTRERGRGKGSDAQVELLGAFVFTLQRGHVVRFKGYVDRAEALEAAGLQR